MYSGSLSPGSFEGWFSGWAVVFAYRARPGAPKIYGVRRSAPVAIHLLAAYLDDLSRQATVRFH